MQTSNAPHRLSRLIQHNGHWNKLITITFHGKHDNHFDAMRKSSTIEEQLDGA